MKKKKKRKKKKKKEIQRRTSLRLKMEEISKRKKKVA